MSQKAGPLETKAREFADTKPPKPLVREVTRDFEKTQADVNAALDVLYRIDTTGADEPGPVAHDRQP